jgi:hypothetical protein
MERPSFFPLKTKPDNLTKCLRLNSLHCSMQFFYLESKDSLPSLEFDWKIPSHLPSNSNLSPGEWIYTSRGNMVQASWAAERWDRVSERGIMKKGILFFGIAGLTAFLLISVVGMAAAAQIQPAPVPASTIDPQILADIQARDQAARDLIQNANEQILSASAEPEPSSTQESTATPAPTPWPISPEAALAIVHLVAPGATVTAPPALVSFQGTPAYEIKTNLGLVYVDAATGKVLYNGAIRISEYVPPASSGGGGGGSHEDDGERSKHDD